MIRGAAVEIVVCIAFLFVLALLSIAFLFTIPGNVSFIMTMMALEIFILSVFDIAFLIARFSSSWTFLAMFQVYSC